MKILIVEDNQNLGATLQEYLEDIGSESRLAKNCQIAREYFKNLRPDIVLLDIGLPDGSGLELAREFKKERNDFNLLFLSAMNDPDIRVEGLEIGADDYITKPFALKELTLRLNKITEKRAQKEVLHLGRLKIWFSRFEVADGAGNIISLSKKECEILELLYRERNKAVTRDQILNKIWGDDQFPSNRTIDNYIVKLRKWCETDPDADIEIKSIRGVGYMLKG